MYMKQIAAIFRIVSETLIAYVIVGYLCGDIPPGALKYIVCAVLGLSLAIIAGNL